MAIYEPLTTITLATDNMLLHPAALPELVHLDDSALDCMIDFKRVEPVTISAKATIDHAHNEMKTHDIHVLIVLNKDKQIIGLISSEDILGEEPIKVMQARQLTRTEILVRMVMTPQAKIAAFNFEDLAHAKVAHIINTLQELKQQYALVINHNDKPGKQIVCGMFSASQISRQLHHDINTNNLDPQSLIEIQKFKKY